MVSVGALASEASASHYRHHNINWQEVSGAPAGEQRIAMQFEQSWRGTPAVGTNVGCLQAFNWGDGRPDTCPDFIVEFVNTAEDYYRAQAVMPGTTDPNIIHDYADPNGTYTINGYSSCCTISTLNNHNDGSWNILSTVNLGGDDESAVSTIPAVVTLAPNGVRTFNVPATDAGGETLFYRLSDVNESCAGSCNGTPHPPGISINSSTGQVTLDTTGLDGLNWTGVVIESRNASNQVVATSHIQYIIKVASGGSANQAPVWDSPPTPADGAEFTVAPGDPVNFTVQASDPDSGDTVTILKNSGPGTFTPSNGNPATGAYTFTPTAGDAGQDFIVQFIAQDGDGAGPPFRSYTIKVRSTEGPNGDATCSDSVDNDGDGQTDAADSDCDAPTPTTEGPAGDATCSDSTDNDGDGQTDQADADCQSPEGPNGDANCSDGVDNDGDGQTDAADADCKPAGPKCFGQTPTIDRSGDNSGVTVVGTSGDDIILTGNGDDTVDGLGGNDLICTVDGDDTVRGGTGDDQIFGGRGNDRLQGQAGDDRVNGGDGNDNVHGGSGTDVVRGQDGDDVAQGGEGDDDQVYGGRGDDTVNGGDGANDYCDGDAGTYGPTGTNDRTTRGGGCETQVNFP